MDAIIKEYNAIINDHDEIITDDNKLIINIHVVIMKDNNVFLINEHILGTRPLYNGRILRREICSIIFIQNLSGTLSYIYLEFIRNTFMYLS